MITKLIIILMLVAMVASLALGMVYMLRDRGSSNRLVKALSWRIGIWLVLFALLAAGIYSGIITPSNSLRPVQQVQPVAE